MTERDSVTLLIGKPENGADAMNRAASACVTLMFAKLPSFSGLSGLFPPQPESVTPESL